MEEELQEILSELHQYNEKIETNIEKYTTNKNIKMLSIKIDNSTLFKGLFSENKDDAIERLELIKTINSGKIKNLSNIQDKIFNEVKYSLYASHKFMYYTILRNLGIVPKSKLEVGNNIISYNENGISYIFREKRGISFGTILEISSQLNKNSYFIKAYRNYLATNEKITGTTVDQLSTSQQFGSTGKQPQLVPNMDNMDIDFRELFVYKLLQYLDFGAKIDFFVNPYLRKALYFTSKSLNPENKDDNYGRLDEISNYKTVDQLHKENIDILETQLTEMDLVARSLLLADMHSENIMFKKAYINNILNYDFKIVDFIIPSIDKIGKLNSYHFMETLREMQMKGVKAEIQQGFTIAYFGVEKDINYSYVLMGISESFIKADNITKYSTEKGKDVITQILKKDENNVKDRNLKRECGRKALQLLERRLQNIRQNQLNIQTNLTTIMEEAERDIMDFIENKNPILNKKNRSILGLHKKDIEDKLEELHIYQSCVLKNLENITSFINSPNEIENINQ